MGGIMYFCMENAHALLWLLATVVLLAVEASTAQMVCIWFAIGSFVSIIAAMLGAPGIVQFLIFVGVSALTLVFTRRIAVDFLRVRKTATNADSVIGLCGSVIQEIDNLAETGRVRVNGLDWTARTSDNSVVHIGETVVVQAINGVKVIVLRK